jgi:putative transcriptional regulator
MYKESNIENDFFTKVNFRFDPKSLKAGVVLISEPFLNDPNFLRSVILISHYSPQDGAVGFVINHMTNQRLDETNPFVSNKSHRIYEGGPVDKDLLFCLHTDHPAIPLPQNPIIPKLYFSSDIESIIPAINSGQLDNRSVKFFSGYSGWAAGQLEQELTENTWIIGNLTRLQILRVPSFRIWRMALEKMGPKYKALTNFPIDPSLN